MLCPKSTQVLHMAQITSLWGQLVDLFELFVQFLLLISNDGGGSQLFDFLIVLSRFLVAVNFSEEPIDVHVTVCRINLVA